MIKCERNELQPFSVDHSRFTCSGIYTSRMNPTFGPIPQRPTCFFVLQNAISPHPTFPRTPVWLKPLLYILHQHGYSENWLCSLFRDLPVSLIKEIRSAFFAVTILALNHVRLIETNQPILWDITTANQTVTKEPWSHDYLGLSDEDLYTFHTADFGVMRYVFMPVFKHWRFLLVSSITRLQHAPFVIVYPLITLPGGPSSPSPAPSPSSTSTQPTVASWPSPPTSSSPASLIATCRRAWAASTTCAIFWWACTTSLAARTTTTWSTSSGRQPVPIAIDG